jgi:hypothetical protein
MEPKNLHLDKFPGDSDPADLDPNLNSTGLICSWPLVGRKEPVQVTR